MFYAHRISACHSYRRQLLCFFFFSFKFTVVSIQMVCREMTKENITESFVVIKIVCRFLIDLNVLPMI